MKDTCRKLTRCKKNRTIAIVFVLIMMPMILNFGLLNIAAGSEDQINYFGTVVPCGKDNGYIPNTSSSWNPWTLLTMPGTVMGLIDDDDPHKGWSLGSFFVQGFSGTTTSDRNIYGKDMTVYLKNAGDTVTFGFKLDQNIDALNGNKKLKIYNDRKKIQDCWVDDPYITGDLGRGVLIIVHTDYEGNQTITTYRDYLYGKTIGANTEVQLFEEGDYRVILCYEIYKDTSWNWVTDWMDPNGSWFDYRLESYFSVRNGNSMVFPFELSTGEELTNRSYTETGFRVDLAKSRYLVLSVKKEILNAAGTDIIEDTRFNKVVADNTEFVDEGKYTITVHNIYTDLITEKIIYVGTNDVMRCNAVTGKSISEINSYLEQGYGIKEDGTLYKLTVSDNSNSTQYNDTIQSEKTEKINMWMIVSIVLIAIITIAGVVMALIKIFG